MAQTEKEVFNVREAAQFLGISERTIRQLITEQQVPFARVGGSLRLRRTALVEWLQQEEQRNLKPNERISARSKPEDEEEGAARARAVVGKYAHVPFSSEDLIRERRAEVEADPMTVVPTFDLKALIADKVALRRILEEQDKLTGFVPDPAATPQKAREMILADGVRPEENVASRDIIRMREREEE
jgi:excisionase family DNA binding protein